MATLARSCGRVGAISRHVRAPIQARMFSASAAAGPVTATFVTTAGSFKAELMTDTMPITTSNFIDLCQNGFYDGVHFHRVRICTECSIVSRARLPASCATANHLTAKGAVLARNRSFRRS